LHRVVPAWQLAAGIAVIFFSLVGDAKLSDHWQTHLPQEVFLKLVPPANEQHFSLLTEQARLRTARNDKLIYKEPRFHERPRRPSLSEGDLVKD
jgi:hypothetical protein